MSDWYFLATVGAVPLVIGPFTDEAQALVNVELLTRDRRGVVILLPPWGYQKHRTIKHESAPPPPPPPRPDSSTDTAARMAP